MNELHLFAGAGGGILGGILLGHTCVCAVEIEPYCRKVLLQRQRDGILPKFPIWDDVTTFDGHPWRGMVDVVSGGFPCQDISAAGRGKGIRGERSGLWAEMARIIGEVQPKFVLVENSPMLTLRGLGVVLGDLATLGYDARWGVMGTETVGGPCVGERLWILAATHQERLYWTKEARHTVPVRKVHSHELQYGDGVWREADGRNSIGEWKSLLDMFCGMDYGVAHYVDRIAAIGNGQVPACVRLAWETLSYGISEMA